jgi:hypothetical protein
VAKRFGFDNLKDTVVIAHDKGQCQHFESNRQQSKKDKSRQQVISTLYDVETELTNQILKRFQLPEMILEDHCVECYRFVRHFPCM